MVAPVSRFCISMGLQKLDLNPHLHSLVAYSYDLHGTFADFNSPPGLKLVLVLDLAAFRNYYCRRQFHSAPLLLCIYYLLPITILIAKINLVYFCVFTPFARQRNYGF